MVLDQDEMIQIMKDRVAGKEVKADTPEKKKFLKRLDKDIAYIRKTGGVVDIPVEIDEWHYDDKWGL